MSTQEEAIALVKSGKNCYIGGGAGRGKSWVIRQITEKNTVLCGPTGISALNIAGITCHRAFGLPLGLPTPEDHTKISAKVKKLLSNKNLKRIIIDEIGMVRADMLDLIDSRLKLARGNDLPFGGVQVVVVGDFYQLAPIVSGRERALFYENYSTAFAFGAACWDFETVELEHAYRHANETHVKVLDTLRKGGRWSWRAFEWLEENTMPYDDAGENLLHLCCYKEDAARINAQHYAALEAPERTYKGSTNATKWSNDIAVPQLINLKVGAKVIIRANDVEGDYTNGMRGVIKALYATTAVVTLDDGGEDVTVQEFTWETYTYKPTAKGIEKIVEFVYSQIPLQLGWGITIHSSQGMTLEGVALDVGRGCFTHGQFYVAVSRVRNLENLSIVSPIGLRDLIVDPEVKAFYGDP